MKRRVPFLLTRVLPAFLVIQAFWVSAQSVVTTYSEDFANPVNLDLWWPNKLKFDDSTYVFTPTQENGYLKYDVKQKNFYDGQSYHFTDVDSVIFDLTGSPFMSVDLKVDPVVLYDGDTVDNVLFLASPWGPDSTGANVRQVNSPAFTVPADGKWHTYVFDFGAQIGVPLWNGVVPPGDLSSIRAILFEAVKWPSTYEFTFSMDNFLLGDAAAPPPSVETYEEDFSDPVSMDLWWPNREKNDDSTYIFTASQEPDSTFKYVMKQKVFSDGQFYNIYKNDSVAIDLRKNPFMSIDIKVEPGALYDGDTVEHVQFLASPWGVDVGELVREVNSPVVQAPADGQWHTYFFNFGEQLGVPLWNGVVPKGDFSSIRAILFEAVKWPSTYEATFSIDNFKLGIAAAPPTTLTTYLEDFEDSVSMDLWWPNREKFDDSTYIFTVKQENGVLDEKIKQAAFYNGQHYHFLRNDSVVFDLRANPYMAVDLKIDKGALYDGDTVDFVTYLASPWSVDAGTFVRQVASPTIQAYADGKWHTYYFDFSEHLGEKLYNGVIPPGDFHAVEAILFESAKWPQAYEFHMQMDNFRLGSAAKPPEVVDSYVENFNDSVSMDLWWPNRLKYDDSTYIFTPTQEMDAMTYKVKQKNFWNGQFYNITKNENVIVDISENPFFTVDIKVDSGALYDGEPVDEVLFLASPWGPDSNDVLVREVNSPAFNVPADGQWHTYTFDFGAQVGVPLWNGVLPPGDMSSIRALLLEAVKYPNTYEFTFSMDNFKLGKAAAPAIINKSIPPVANKFWAQWRVTPSHDNMNGATGLAKGPVSAWNDYGVIVRFGPSGMVDAHNGSGYSAENAFPYTADSTYVIEVIGDVATQTYKATVWPMGSTNKVVIADNYGFRPATSQDTLNYFVQKIEENPSFGTPGARLKPSFAWRDYILGWYNMETNNENMTAMHEVDVTLTPTAEKINAAFALSKEVPSLLGWGELSTIIRFNNSGLVDVRNGGSYSADNVLIYEKGVPYKVKMIVDVPNQTYSVTVEDLDGNVTELAKDYAFRAAADSLNVGIKQELIGGPFGGAEGDLVVSDLSIITVGSKDIPASQFSVTPNPVKDRLYIHTQGENMKYSIHSMEGKQLLQGTISNSETGVVDVSGLSKGSYVLRVTNGEKSGTRVFIKQ